MRTVISVDVRELVKMADRFPNATGVAINTFTRKVGFRIERDAKYAMKANVAGPGQARSRSGNLAKNIRFIDQGMGQLAGVVKAFANYSKYVHGPPYHNFIPKKAGGFRKTNPFFSTALQKSEAFIDAEKSKIIPNIFKNL